MYQYYLPYIKEGLWTNVLLTNLVMVIELVSLQGIRVAFMEPDFHSVSSEQLISSESNKVNKSKKGEEESCTKCRNESN